MSTPSLFPWQVRDWQQVWSQRDRLPHALLVTGHAGIGKRRFAEYLCHALLCEGPVVGSRPCGNCDACHWLRTGNHPDLRLLTPAEDEKSQEVEGKRKLPVIKVDGIREVGGFISLTAHRKGQRVVLIDPAEAMNNAAANAFLKILEEPPSGVHFILVSHHWRLLLPTIRSRCSLFHFSTPNHEFAVTWLKEQGIENPDLHLAHTSGAPLDALADAQAQSLPQRRAFLEKIAKPRTLNVLHLAEALEKQKLETESVIEWLQKWVYDLISLQSYGLVRYYPDWYDDLTRLSKHASRLFSFFDYLNQSMRLAHHPLNQRLVLESLLFAYLDIFRRTTFPEKIRENQH